MNGPGLVPGAPDTGELRGDVLELLRGPNRQWASPAGDIPAARPA
jgi:hypothetical protein